MRNSGHILILIILVFSCMQCVSEKVQTEKAIQELMPPVPPSFSSADSVKLIANWTLGIKMYKSNCTHCHGIFGEGKDSVPNFSKEQYDEYLTSYLARDSANHAVLAKMTEEELNDVFLFLIDFKR